MFDVLVKRLRFGYFSREKQKAFLEDLSMLMDEGLPLVQAIDTIGQVSAGITKRVASQIAQHIARGQPLAEGMQARFSQPLVEIIRAGENSGALKKALKSAVYLFSQKIDAGNRFFTMLASPAFVVITALVMMVFIRHVVLDSFATIRPIAEWPNVGQMLYRVSFLIEQSWWLILLSALFIAYLILRLLRQWTGDVRSLLDKMPFISLYRDILAAEFMETLGLLISNGVLLKTALGIMHQDAVPYLSWHILKMEFHVSGGKKNIADVLDTQLISERDIVHLRVVAQSKGFEYALMSLGRKANRRVVKAISFVGKLSGGVLLFCGAVIAAVVLLGLYSVGSSIMSF